MKKLSIIISITLGMLVVNSAYSFAPDYEQKLMTPLKSEDAAEIGKQLKKLQATIDALCLKTRGFTVNVVSADFYEYHSFLNLTVEYLQKASYDVSERSRTLGAWGNISVGELLKETKVQDAPSLVTEPKDMIAQLLPDYEKITDLSRGIFRMAASVGDAGTIALMTQTTGKLEHFLWEIRVMAEGGKPPLSRAKP